MRKYVLGVVLAVLPVFSVFGATASPSVDEMWRMIQQQQAQIDGLQRELEGMKAQATGSAQQLDKQELIARIERTEQQLEATASAVETVFSGSDGNTLTSATHIGGYGELHYNDFEDEEELDLHRFVLFFSHQFNKELSFFSELEVEHSIAGEGKVGEVEIEQAFVQWDYSDAHRAKFGLFLLPVGIINETHEPNTFYGVERNGVERNIIPATWWEGGVSLEGEIAPGWGYDLALHSGLNLDTDNGSASRRSSIRSARQKVGESNADSLAWTARLRYSGIPGLQWKATVQYQEDLTQGDDDGVGIDDLGALLFETDLTLERGMFGLRALYARWDIDDEIEVLNPGSDEQFGWYIEPSVRLSPSLGLFARYGVYDLNAGDSRTSNEHKEIDIGISYWLHENVVIKAGYQRQDSEQGDDVNGVNLGVGYSF